MRLNDSDLTRAACALLLLFCLCACSTVTRVTDAPEVTAPPVAADTSHGETEVPAACVPDPLDLYAVPAGPGADDLEERAWTAAFHAFRESVIRQCLRGGCRFEVPEEYDFVNGLKTVREHRRQQADAAAGN